MTKQKMDDWDRLTLIVYTIVETAELGGLKADSEKIYNIICNALSDVEEEKIADCNAQIHQLLVLDFEPPKYTNHRNN